MTFISISLFICRLYATVYSFQSPWYIASQKAYPVTIKFYVSNFQLYYSQPAENLICKNFFAIYFVSKIHLLISFPLQASDLFFISLRYALDNYKSEKDFTFWYKEVQLCQFILLRWYTCPWSWSILVVIKKSCTCSSIFCDF